MTTTQMIQNNSQFVSTFLSHSSQDSALAEAVADRLGRRGVVAWLDKNELLEMGSLSTALKQAVQQQATLTIFLSDASLSSKWCEEELKWAIEAQEGTDHLLPVYIGDPLTLVKKHKLLRTRFLNPDGKRVDQLGYVCQPTPTAADADAIAEKIAATAYQRSIPETWSDVVIMLDQRGNGPRRGTPILPHNFAQLSAPVLTFRPSSKPRQLRELLTGADWQDTVNMLEQSLSSALGTLRGKTRQVRVIGHAQTGLMWAIGKHFDRTTSADLYGYDRDGLPVTNEGQVRHTSLPGGDPDTAKLVAGPLLTSGAHQSEVAIGIGTKAKFAPTVQQAVSNLPLYWIESGFIEDSEQAMDLVKNLVASVERLRREYSVQELVLFWTTANHVALLAAANLTTHIIPKIKFMEWDHAQSQYVHLPMPGD